MMHLKTIVGAAILALAINAQVALAHSHLKSSEPANGSQLKSAPKQLKLVFEESVQLTAVSIVGDDGKTQALKPLPAQPTKEASVPLPKLGPGKYIVNWRASGHDGHVIFAKLTFTVAPKK